MECLLAFDNQMVPPETIIYQLRNKDQLIRITQNIEVRESKNQRRYFIHSEGTDDIISDLQINDQLQTLSYLQKKGPQLLKDIHYSEDNINVWIPPQNIRYQQPLNRGNFYDMNSFPYLFRGFPFQNKKELIFNSHLPEFQRFFTIYLKIVGTENYSYNQKTINCYKLELGAAGWVESVLFPEQFYFLISTTSPHRFLRYWGTNNAGRIDYDLRVIYDSILDSDKK